MRTASRQSRRLDHSGAVEPLRERTGDAAPLCQGIPPWTEAEHEALSRAIPGQIFRIKLEHDGSATIVGHRHSTHIPAATVANPAVRSAEKSQLQDPAMSLNVELARRARGLLNESLRTGEVQIVEVQTDHKGKMTLHEVRAIASAPGALLAVVRDVARQEAEGGLARSQHELSRLSEVLQNRVGSPGEDEKMVKNIFVRLNGLLEDTITAIQSIVETNDPFTAHHQARVWKLACAIGREMGMGKTQVDVIGLAALVHDFGKMFIPADVLNKPGKLTEDEFSAVKNHAETVFQILRTIDLFCPIADIVHQHHERMDGSGYPLGLKGDDILIEARIIAVADVVEAMLSDRPHRPALTVDAAMAEIASGRGRLYDANAADACIRLFRVNKFEFD